MKILTISGSLKAKSTNSQLLNSLRLMAPVNLELESFDIGSLPHFNPDLDGATPPGSVSSWREKLGTAEGVLISSPEYAHGVPGALKNALDWIVSSGEFSKKPVVLLGCSSGDGEHAQAHLGEILKTMEADIILAATLSAPMIRQAIGADGRIAVEAVATALLAILTELEESVKPVQKN